MRMSLQCLALTWPCKSPLFPDPEEDVVGNDWCIMMFSINTVFKKNNLILPIFPKVTAIIFFLNFDCEMTAYKQ